MAAGRAAQPQNGAPVKVIPVLVGTSEPLNEEVNDVKFGLPLTHIFQRVNIQHTVFVFCFVRSRTRPVFVLPIALILRGLLAFLLQKTVRTI